MPAKGHSPTLDTALHVAKGAIVKIFNTPVTASVTYTKPKEARILVDYPFPEQPTAEQLKQAENLANEIIEKNLPITEETLTIPDAEKKFASGVNGTYIFDKIKPKVDSVNVILIPDWNVNCCAGPHLASTGEIGKIGIPRFNFKAQKQQCEFIVELNPTAQAQPANQKAKKWEANAKKSTKQPKQVVVVEEKIIPPLTPSELSKASNVQILSESLLDEIFKELQLDDQKKAAAKEKLLPSVKTKLTTLKNQSYTQGFTAGKNL